MLDPARILSKQEIGKMIIEDAVKYAFERKLYIRVYVYGNYYDNFCLKYLLQPNSEIISMIKRTEELKEVLDNDLQK